MEMIAEAALGFWATLCAMAPYLLFGFAAAGLLSVMVPRETVERHLGGKRRPMWSVIKASLFGIPLPLCSCSVIPVAASLRRHGASRGAAASFLLSTPTTGVDSILVTYSLLGPVFAVFRPVVALVSGVLGGALVNAAGEPAGEAGQPGCCREACCGGEGKGRLRRILAYGFGTLPRDIGPAMLVGLALAGLITAMVPENYFQDMLEPMEQVLGGAAASIVSMLVMMLVGLPVYVCATASVPIAGALMAQGGLSGGAALAFLMTGPATNAATVATVWKVLGLRTTAIYLGTVAFTALASGLLLDLCWPGLTADVAGRMHDGEPGLFYTASGLVLLGVLLPAVLSRLKRKIC